MKKHKNIPFFTPHSGCKNSCVFCSQVKITGKESTEYEIDDEVKSLKNTIDESLATIKNANTQLAFFGGSFTGIERHRMIALLETVFSYVKNGKINSIRVSTRPDYIDQSILDTLREYAVTDIELGIQSINDKVLRACARGHNSSIVYKSAELIIKNGFNLAGQMMVGLPQSTLNEEIQTADAIINMGATGARIYPTVVFEGTVLYDMVIRGLYKPITNEEAVERCARVLDRFVSAGVNILKIGLHSSENLARAEYGANHPAIGELVKAKLYYLRISEILKNMDCRKKQIEIRVSDKEKSKLLGHGRQIINDLIREFDLAGVDVVIAKNEIFKPIIRIKDGKQCVSNQ